MLKILISTTFTCLIYLTATPVIASVFYTYTGNTYQFLDYENNVGGTDYDMTMSVSGYLELTSPLTANMQRENVTPINFSFNDGINTITEATAVTDPGLGHLGFDFTTDSTGEIILWNVFLQQAFPEPIQAGALAYEIFTLNDPGAIISVPVDNGSTHECLSLRTDGITCKGSSEIDGAHNEFVPGTWTVSDSIVPIPSAAWLFGSGILGLIGVARRSV